MTKTVGGWRKKEKAGWRVCMRNWGANIGPRHGGWVRGGESKGQHCAHCRTRQKLALTSSYRWSHPIQQNGNISSRWWYGHGYFQLDLWSTKEHNNTRKVEVFI